MSQPPILKPVNVSYDDFINSFDGDEASELSHLNLPTDQTINKPKIEYQLALAEKRWLSLFGLDLNSDLTTAPSECKENIITCSCALARYRMDYLNARDSVKEAMEECTNLAYQWREEQITLKKMNKEESTDVVMSIFSI